jgi:zinc transporter 1/2/3
LGDGCLTGVITEYPWPEAIALMTVFALFFAELMTMRYGLGGGHDHDHEASHAAGEELTKTSRESAIGDSIKPYRDDESVSAADGSRYNPHARGQDHLGHSREHQSNDALPADWERTGFMPESYAAQMTAIFILEFGVIFHSIFIGLTLAVAGDEFTTRMSNGSMHRCSSGY